MSESRGEERKRRRWGGDVLLRKQLLAENGATILWTLTFSKLILFKQYLVLNVPLKLLLLYGYWATLDPLVVYSGYRLTRLLEESREE
jgi:hypothetical protein